MRPILPVIVAASLLATAGCSDGDSDDAPDALPDAGPGDVSASPMDVVDAGATGADGSGPSVADDAVAGGPTEGATTDASVGTPEGIPGDAADASRIAFREALVGARDYGCEAGEPGAYSTRFVDVFTDDGRFTSELYLHENPDCSDRPLSFATQLSIESWTLTDPLVSADGREAFGIDFETLQERLESGGLAGYGLGTVAYDIVALEDGGVTLGTELPASAAQRGDTLFDPSPATPWEGLSAPAGRDALQGTFAAACFRGKEQTRAFEGPIFTETVVHFLDDACAESYATKITRWEVAYGEATRTVFGDAVLATRIVAADSVIEDVLVDSRTPELPVPTEIGKTFFDIWGVVGEELVVGTCLDKGPGDCGTTEALRADVLNANVGNRYVRR